MHIEKAHKEDYAEMSALLNENNLPAADLSLDHMHTFIIRENDSIIAMAAIEGNAPDGLLRSVAVRADYQNKGYGKILIDYIIQYANMEGYSGLWLLTETAAAFFVRRGFKTTHKNEAPLFIAETTEFKHVCPSSATTMTIQFTS